ncbi:MAG: primosomal protein N' [Bacteroidales bacterium]|jgi:primosomal protein N' (replication factor Y)|nr:primosomal protein N' [Bacteroidales bacterium]
MPNNPKNTTSTLYANVILPLSVPLLYTYAVPPNMSVAPGSRVVVQLGKRKMYTAIVHSLHNTKPEQYETKNIHSVLDEKPIVTEKQLQLWDWIATYYMCTRGDVMKAALPSGLKLESEAMLYANPAFSERDSLTDKEELIFTTIHENTGISINDLQKLFSFENITATVQTLLQKGIILTGEKLLQGYKPKIEIRYRLPQVENIESVVNNAVENLSKAPKQQSAFLAFLDLYMKSKNPNFSISRKELLIKTSTNLQIVSELTKKGFLEEFDSTRSRIEIETAENQTAKQLNPAQQNALQQIITSFSEHKVCLLHGVTASGKTEVYIHLIQHIVAQGKQVLYLLPEIALTSQIIVRLRRVFGNKVGVYHSKFSDNERVEVWNNLLAADENSYSIVLGARSTVFLPFHNLGLVIVDEEHETSFKQYDPAPRYNARDTAIVLAQMFGAPTLLGTATPSVETYYNVQQHKYALVELTERYSQVQLPHIEIIDLNTARKQKRMYDTLFSKQLIEKIEELLREKQQIILFQNRRGFAPYIECTACGHIPKCKHCDVTLTYHKGTNSLRCHYCGFSQRHSVTCLACGSSAVEHFGFGTEKIEDTLREIFPEKHIKRMDLDSTRGKNSYNEIIEAFENREIDILVGTQMITKGLDFDNVGLVGILQADSLLNMPDFRSFERAYQVMTQVAGRAGRAQKQGLVYIQGYNVQHEVLKAVQHNTFHNFIEQQMLERQNFHFPPFVRLLRISVKHKNRQTAEQAATQLANLLQQLQGISIMGPEYPLIARLQTLYIQELLIKIPRTQSLEQVRNTVNKAIQSIAAQANFKSVQCICNVDPY